jgi:uncharacterized protein with HEPN domain
MSQREGSIRLKHMLDHSREAVDSIAGKSRADLDTDRQLNLALVRLLEIVGEAASRTTEDERRLCPTLPWGQIVGLRNRLIHGYDAVDFDVLWQVVRDDLPRLIAELEPVLGEDAL